MGRPRRAAAAQGVRGVNGGGHPPTSLTDSPSSSEGHRVGCALEPGGPIDPNPIPRCPWNPPGSAIFVYKTRVASRGGSPGRRSPPHRMRPRGRDRPRARVYSQLATIFCKHLVRPSERCGGRCGPAHPPRPSSAVGPAGRRGPPPPRRSRRAAWCRSHPALGYTGWATGPATTAGTTSTTTRTSVCTTGTFPTSPPTSTTASTSTSSVRVVGSSGQRTKRWWWRRWLGGSCGWERLAGGGAAVDLSVTGRG